MGCPCDSYECEDDIPTVTPTTSMTTTTAEPAAEVAVLMLAKGSSQSHVPMVIGFNG